MNLKTGTRLGPYEIVAPIGAGGMGEVYRAVDTRLGRTVAVKTLPNEFADDAKLKIRFQREAKAISALNHPHICTLYDVGDSYLVMEYCDGKTLSQRIAEGALPLEEVLQYGIEIADGLDNAHRQGIVHRDLKPSNIMITSGGVKLLDFGLAKQKVFDSSSDSTTVELVTEDGKIIGTIQYMSPEVLLGKPADTRSDIFALGLILYEMLTGKRAFDGTTKASIIAAILEREPVPVSEHNPKTPPALDLLIRACLAKNPEERVQTANDVRLQLRTIADGGQQPLTPRARLHTATAGPRSHRRLAAGAALAVIIAIGAGVLVWHEQRAAAIAPIRSLVVLPFENISKPDDEYLVAGMHNGVIGELSQISGLRLISRTSAMHYKDAKKTIPEIARDLNVDGVVEGSVLRSGNGVRILVTLIRARPEEKQMWSKTYERGLDGVLAIQSEIARAVASASKVALSSDEAVRLSKERRVNPAAYEAYVKGMFHVQKQTPEAARKGIEYLTQAVASDPADPFAYGGLALAYSTIGHGPAAPPDAFIRANAAARKAIEIDDTLPEPHAALGAIALYHDWDWPKAERELRRALELNANFAHAHRDYAWFQQIRGHLDDAIAEMNRAKNLDPLSPMYPRELAWLYRSRGRIDDAIREGRNAVELDPNLGIGHRFLAQVCSERGLHDEAIAAAQRAVALQPVFRYALAYVYARAGRRSEAEKILAELEASKPAPIFGWGLAEAYTALGRNDDAFRWLEKGMEWRFSWMPSIDGDPALAPLHGDPRYQALVRRLKLPT
ncbi:MAG: protein kinase domain-containing protein [Thermoanaerobaculia bacterium]